MSRSAPAIDPVFLYAFSLLELGPASLHKLSHHFQNDFRQAWQANATDLQAAGLTAATVKKIVSLRPRLQPEKEWRRLNNSQIQFITINDGIYPEQLRQIKTAPFILFGQGNFELLNDKQIAVVGTRRPDDYGKMATEKIVPQLTAAGLTVTSGLAQGIDSLAHQAALNSGGKTIAVLGAGLMAARQNGWTKQMMDKIIGQDGLVLSEYHPLYPASKFTFPARNRIVSGLSLGVLVMAAGKKSGALITANYALEQGREVFTIPGSIFSSQTIGNHQLLKSGAQLVTAAEDILENLGFQTNLPLSTKTVKLDDKEERIIYEKLSLDPITIDKLAKKCSLPTTVVISKLSLLELKGLARNIGGGRFVGV